jgi:signal peptidase II
MNSFPADTPSSSTFYPWLLPFLLLFTVGSDQLSKAAARKILPTLEESEFFGGLLKFSLVENYGGFLGIVSTWPSELRFFFLHVCVAVLLAVILVYLLWFANRHSSSSLALTFITGGGISNLLDRLIRDGGVTDFIIVGAGPLQTGIFNGADVYILFASFYLGFRLFKDSGKDGRQSSP